MSYYHITIKVPYFVDRILVWPMLMWRWLWYGYSFRKIKLVNSQYYAKVDQCDFTALSQYEWFVDITRDHKRAMRIDKSKGPKTIVHMHREILFNSNYKLQITDFKFKKSTQKTERSSLPRCNVSQSETKDGYGNNKLIVDHIDNDGLNNCRSNLRFATKQQNNMNRSKRKGAKYKGIYKINRPKPWVANLSYNNKTIYIGSYKTDVEAAKAYDEAAKKYHGQFANLNFPVEKKRGLRRFLRLKDHLNNDMA